MVDLSPGVRPYFPALARIYRPLEPFAWLLVRVAAGAMLMPHGAQKLLGWFGGDLTSTIAFFGKAGLSPPAFWAYYVGSLELIGGLLLTIGLFTRPVALLVAGFMAVAVFYVHWNFGFFWTSRGFEYPLMWMMISLALVIHGGGRYSVDAAMRREI